MGFIRVRGDKSISALLRSCSRLNGPVWTMYLELCSWILRKCPISLWINDEFVIVCLCKFKLLINDDFFSISDFTTHCNYLYTCDFITDILCMYILMYTKLYIVECLMFSSTCIYYMYVIWCESVSEYILLNLSMYKCEILYNKLILIYHMHVSM